MKTVVFSFIIHCVIMQYKFNKISKIYYGVGTTVVYSIMIALKSYIASANGQRKLWCVISEKKIVFYYMKLVYTVNKYICIYYFCYMNFNVLLCVLHERNAKRIHKLLLLLLLCNVKQSVCICIYIYNFLHTMSFFLTRL